MSDIITNPDGSVTVTQETLLKWVNEKNELVRQRDQAAGDLVKMLQGMKPIYKMLGLDSGKPPTTMQLMKMIPKLWNNPDGMFNGIGEVLEKYQHLIFE